MGGPGSGWNSRGSRYLATGQCYDLDLSDLVRRGYFRVPKVEASGPYTWTTHGGDRDGEETTVDVAIDTRTDPATYRIMYALTSGDDRQPVTLTGELYTTTPQYGGLRYWWRCIRCWRRCRVLYAYPARGRERFACRQCQRLRYYSEREITRDRLMRKAKKLFKRAGSRDGSEPWIKPPWMRWNTFSRLVLAGRAARDTADGMMLHSLGMALASIQGGRKRRASR